MTTRRPNDYSEFLLRLVRECVSYPNDIETIATPIKGGLKLVLKANRADQGKVIGTGGATIKALRTMAGMAARNNNQWKLGIEVLEPTNGETYQPRSFSSDPEWNRLPEIERLVQESLLFMFPGITTTVQSGPHEAQEEPGSIMTVTTDQHVGLAIESAVNTVFNAAGKQQGHTLRVGIKHVRASD